MSCVFLELISISYGVHPLFAQTCSILSRFLNLALFFMFPANLSLIVLFQTTTNSNTKLTILEFSVDTRLQSSFISAKLLLHQYFG